jgi:hypothetical protein
MPAARDCPTPGRLEVGDTADWKSALLPELDAALDRERKKNFLVRNGA